MNLTNLQKDIISCIVHFVTDQSLRDDVFEGAREASGLTKAVEEVQTLWINPGRRQGKSTAAKIVWRMLVEAGYPTTLVVHNHTAKADILKSLGEHKEKYSSYIKVLGELKVHIERSKEKEPVIIMDDCGLYQHNDNTIKSLCANNPEGFKPTVVSIGTLHGINS